MVLKTLPTRWLVRPTQINSALLLWSRDHINAAALILNLMYQLTSLSLKRVVEHQQVLCKLVLTGATASTKELHACLPKILLTMMHQFKDAQPKIMLMLILISILLSDFHRMFNKLKLSFTNLVPVDSMSFLQQKLRKISEISFKVSGLSMFLILNPIWLTQ